MLIAALVIFIYMCVLFLIAIAIKNNGLADVGWGLGFLLVAITTLIASPAVSIGNWLISIAVFIWGVRLGTYLFIRNIGKPEDWRYAKWRAEWGKNVIWRSFLQVFMLQGAIMYVNVLPVIIANSNMVVMQNPIGFYVVGILLWSIGMFFETVADAQMYFFKKNPGNKGKVMNIGLWRYSRHPNYFGEMLLHWGIWLVSVPFGYWYISIIAPITITFLLLKVSGVTMLEEKYDGNSEYDRYKRNTSKFIPLPPHYQT